MKVECDFRTEDRLVIATPLHVEAKELGPITITKTVGEYYLEDEETWCTTLEIEFGDPRFSEGGLGYPAILGKTLTSLAATLEGSTRGSFSLKEGRHG